MGTLETLDLHIPTVGARETIILIEDWNISPNGIGQALDENRLTDEMQGARGETPAQVHRPAEDGQKRSPAGDSATSYGARRRHRSTTKSAI